MGQQVQQCRVNGRLWLPRRVYSKICHIEEQIHSNDSSRSPRHRPHRQYARLLSTPIATNAVARGRDTLKQSLSATAPPGVHHIYTHIYHPNRHHRPPLWAVRSNTLDRITARCDLDEECHLMRPGLRDTPPAIHPVKAIRHPFTPQRDTDSRLAPIPMFNNHSYVNQESASTSPPNGMYRSLGDLTTPTMIATTGRHPAARNSPPYGPIVPVYTVPPEMNGGLSAGENRNSSSRTPTATAKRATFRSLWWAYRHDTWTLMCSKQPNSGSKSMYTTPDQNGPIQHETIETNNR
jgi:hypothetical protein